MLRDDLLPFQQEVTRGALAEQQQHSEHGQYLEPEYAPVTLAGENR